MNALVMPRTASLLALLSLSLAACSPAADVPAEEPPLAGARIGGDFTLTSGAGEEVSWSDFAGQYRMVYFGYTSCPDVCPYDTQRMVRARQAYLEENPDTEIAAIFITVDPARDTPEALAQFTGNFAPDLVGLTGSEEQIDEVVKDFAAYRALEEEDEYGFYKVTHGPPGAYLFGPQGEPLALLPVDESVEGTLAEMRRWIR
ncbi:SCO1/SenC family protein [Blastomonas marina]|uniref:SCO1/SenC family protein n=1 Tax=Blastomonas marina TaxID=1867408 RepID=A0ABQ1FER0_9SPHN|nr:SCO family protein [Blastomonas marina]GGA09691.1 SCO1/SenC family protein [Blastomonas marina]